MDTSPMGPVQRSFRRWASRRLRVVAGVAAGIAAAGCAPHLVRMVEVAPALRAELYQTEVARREARGVAVDAELLLWAEAAGTRMPGAEARLLLAAPDAFRLRVGSLFGTALDIGARGESLSAYVPSRRRALSLDARRDSLGILKPGGFVFRSASAAWRPPAMAWPGAAWRETLLVVSWLEDSDTLAVAVGGDGLPAWVSLTRPHSEVRVRYQAWDRATGVAWPARFELEDREGAFRLRCKVSRVRFPARPDSLRLAVPIPEGAERLTLAGLRRALERLGSL